MNGTSGELPGDREAWEQKHHMTKNLSWKRVFKQRGLPTSKYTVSCGDLIVRVNFPGLERLKEERRQEKEAIVTAWKRAQKAGKQTEGR